MDIIVHEDHYVTTVSFTIVHLSLSTLDEDETVLHCLCTLMLVKTDQQSFSFKTEPY